MNSEQFLEELVGLLDKENPRRYRLDFARAQRPQSVYLGTYNGRLDGQVEGFKIFPNHPALGKDLQSALDILYRNQGFNTYLNEKDDDVFNNDPLLFIKQRGKVVQPFEKNSGVRDISDSFLELYIHPVLQEHAATFGVRPIHNKQLFLGAQGLLCSYMQNETPIISFLKRYEPSYSNE